MKSGLEKNECNFDVHCDGLHNLRKFEETAIWFSWYMEMNGMPGMIVKEHFNIKTNTGVVKSWYISCFYNQWYVP